ncbi:MAG: Flp pilus assembly complex ATPase component [Lentisphaerae bacterium]|nr:Flp pilus assembly complex ATPase component [Lentisphaerota bacterium]MCP4099873.1 Flp pilus assembly complex ATPase component [Lentisphaerota bacterium]
MNNELTVFENGQYLAAFDPIPNIDYKFGTDSECAMVLPRSSGADSVHASLHVKGRTWWLVDEDSSSGTFMEGRPVATEPIVGETKVRIGSVELILIPDNAIESEDVKKDKYEEVKDRIYEQLLNQISLSRLRRSRINNQELEEKARELLRWVIAENESDLIKFSQLQLHCMEDEIIQDLLKLGPLEPLIEDDKITEIMVTSHDAIYVERKGKIELTNRTFRDQAHLLRVIERIVAPIGRRIDESSPLVDARLPDGSRVNAVIPPIVPDSACLTIRKFGKDVFTADRLLSYGSMTKDMVEFLRRCIKARKNIIISGGTGSGKTSLLNALSAFIDNDERIVTIEDALELKMQQEHIVRMEARPPNIENRGEITIRALVKNSLRMRPDRIIVGECRGGEALDMLQAMNTGHDGSLTTLHANTPSDTVSRLETMVLMAGIELPLSAVRKQIFSAVDIVVQTNRLSDGTRKVTSICELHEMKGDEIDVREIFKFQQTGLDFSNHNKVLGYFTGVNEPSFMEHMRICGMPLNPKWFIPVKPPEEKVLTKSKEEEVQT